MVRKIYIFALIFFCWIFSSKVFATEIDKIISNSADMSPAVIGISVKDANTGNVIYQKNQNTLVHPASTLKVITSAAAVNYLGKYYNFKNAIYKNWNRVYLQVGADPLFSFADAQQLAEQYSKKNTEPIKNFYIDDTIIDKIPYGIGWQWDDNTNPSCPPMSPYTINHNLFQIRVGQNAKGKVVIENPKEYTEKINNNLQFANTDNIKVQRNIFDKDNIITLDGTISKTQFVDIPAKNPKMMYLSVVAMYLMNYNITFNSGIKYEKVPIFSSKEASVTHSIEKVIEQINKNSDNLAAELLIKHVGAAKVDGTGTTEIGLNVVREFYNKNGLNTNNINIVDASGLSMNDYVSADFMTNALVIINNSNISSFIKNSMANSSEGTFKGRVPELRGEIRVKTGTLANTSSVIGYITTVTGKNLVFAIMLDNLPQNVDAKNFEDKIIKEISKL